jgi:pseudo-rSAM protein
LIDEVKYLPLLTINLLGSRIFDHPDVERLMNLLQVKQFRKKIYIPLYQFEPGFLSMIRKNTRMVLLIAFPITHAEIRKLAGIIKEISHKDWVEFNFIVQNSGEVEQSEQLIEDLELHNVYFKPFFNGSNISFFETTVFMTESDIVASKPNQKQILSRYILNENDFGKITLLPDGTVYSNVNEEALGSLRELSIIDLIKKEQNNGRAWKRIRMDEEPCKRCIYHFLCPPVSNYELHLKKFNLCHIEIN